MIFRSEKCLRISDGFRSTKEMIVGFHFPLVLEDLAWSFSDVKGPYKLYFFPQRTEFLIRIYCYRQVLFLILKEMARCFYRGVFWKKYRLELEDPNMKCGENFESLVYVNKIKQIILYIHILIYFLYTNLPRCMYVY